MFCKIRGEFAMNTKNETKEKIDLVQAAHSRVGLFFQVNRLSLSKLKTRGTESVPNRICIPAHNRIIAVQIFFRIQINKIFFLSVGSQFCSLFSFWLTSLGAVTSFKIFSTATHSKSPSVWWNSASSSGSHVFCGTRQIRKSFGRWIRASFSNLPNEKR